MENYLTKKLQENINRFRYGHKEKRQECKLGKRKSLKGGEKDKTRIVKQRLQGELERLWTQNWFGKLLNEQNGEIFYW